MTTKSNKSTAKCKTHRWNDWSYHGPKRIMQIRSCWDCSTQQQRKDPTITKERLDIASVAVFLADGWRRYVHAFGTVPQGTAQQFRAMLEMSYMDQWRTVSDEPQEGKATDGR